eukprot:TRINITY_DN2893_c0_g1_i1.p1 TRINITY_DN2893_c0_g1~~TRINITY_DN2893_c0_g1_i1.p1  ORF type:complete len:613 (+),score=124.97 TRINITY_DN2893_c0_g1_i1:101-1939(+)
MQGTFTAAGGFPVEICGHGMTLVSDPLVSGSFVLVFGGGHVKTHSNKVYRCSTDFLSKGAAQTEPVWEEVACGGEKPSPRSHHSQVFYQGQLFVFGGINEDGVLDDMYTLSIESMVWKKIEQKSMIWPESRCGHSAVAIRSEMCVFGGFHGAGAPNSNDLYFFDFSTHIWTKWSSLDGVVPRGRSQHVCLPGKSGAMRIFGGFNEAMEVFDDLWEWRPVDNRWVHLEPQSKEDQLPRLFGCSWVPLTATRSVILGGWGFKSKSSRSGPPVCADGVHMLSVSTTANKYALFTQPTSLATNGSFPKVANLAWCMTERRESGFPVFLLCGGRVQPTTKKHDACINTVYSASFKDVSIQKVSSTTARIAFPWKKIPDIAKSWSVCVAPGGEGDYIPELQDVLQHEAFCKIDISDVKYIRKKVLITDLEPETYYSMHVVDVGRGMSVPLTSLSFRTTKRKAPDAPRQLQFDAHAMQLLWMPPEEMGGFPLQQYIVYEVNDPKRPQDDPREIGRSDTLSSILSFWRGTMHHIYVVCETAAGVSPPSRVLTVNIPHADPSDISPSAPLSDHSESVPIEEVMIVDDNEENALDGVKNESKKRSREGFPVDVADGCGRDTL